MKNVTKGTAKVLKIDISDYKVLCIGSDSKTDVICHMYLPNYQIEPNHEADAELFADALNTHNATGYTPSELKQQKDELLEVLESILKYHSNATANLTGAELRYTLPFQNARVAVEKYKQ